MSSVLTAINILSTHASLQELAIKLSGLKKPSYNATKQTIKQVLGLNRDITFKDVCVQLGCPEIVSDAEELLQK